MCNARPCTNRADTGPELVFFDQGREFLCASFRDTDRSYVEKRLGGDVFESLRSQSGFPQRGGIKIGDAMLQDLDWQ